ncbi:MAG: hypothetical protein FWC95_08335, partial [Defluviitaleaceae bacterium]|nr:hypothetical protein [Defluviitaleaceae bacterium]
MRLWEAGYPAATVSLLDMVNEQAGGEFDAAIDIMGLHMLVLDDDRKKYLKNAYSVLKSGAPMLFYKESHSEDAYEGIVATFDEWLKISGADYETATEKQVMGTDITVKI